MKLPKLRREGKEKFGCDQNPETGEVHCKSFKELEDGTRSDPTAEMDFQFDGECKPNATRIEGGKGEIDKLSKSVMPLLKQKCKGVPQDY